MQLCSLPHLFGHREQLPSRLWRARVCAGKDPLTGRELRFRKSRKTEVETQIELGKLLALARAGRQPDSDLTVAELLDAYVPIAGWDVSTLETNLGYIRRTIKPALGIKEVRKVRAAAPVALGSGLITWHPLVHSLAGVVVGEHRSEHGVGRGEVRFAHPAPHSVVERVLCSPDRPAVGLAPRGEDDEGAAGVGIVGAEGGVTALDQPVGHLAGGLAADALRLAQLADGQRPRKQEGEYPGVALAVAREAGFLHALPYLLDPAPPGAGEQAPEAVGRICVSGHREAHYNV